MGLDTRPRAQVRAGPAARLRSWLRRERLLLLFGGLALVLGVLDPAPGTRWLEWLQAPTLLGLFALLVSIEGIRASGALQRAALGRLQERIEREAQAMRHWRLAALDLGNDDSAGAGGA